MEMRKRRDLGMTLLELVVVMAILGTLVTASMGLFLRVIRGGTKTEALLASQAGVSLPIDVIESAIRNAQEVSAVGGGGCPGSGNSLTLINSDGGVTKFSLTPLGQIASNSATITPQDVAIEDLGFQCERNEGSPDLITVFIKARGAAVNQVSIAPLKDYKIKVSLRTY